MSDDGYNIDGSDPEGMPVHTDANFPGAVLALLAAKAGFVRGTELHLEIDADLGDGSMLRLCNERHVHLFLGSAMPLYGINIVLMFTWGFARALDALEWKQMPDVEMVATITDAICVIMEPHVPELVSAVRHVSVRNIEGMLSSVADRGGLEGLKTDHETLAPPPKQSVIRPTVVEKTGRVRKVPREDLS